MSSKSPDNFTSSRLELAYTGFVSVLWPSVPLVVVPRMTGLGFGIVTSMQNLGTAILPLIVAAIYTDSGDLYIRPVRAKRIELVVPEGAERLSRLTQHIIPRAGAG